MPTAVRLLRGNPSRRPLPSHEPKIEAGLPPAPKTLDADARKEWFRCGRLLKRAGMISRLDLAVFALYCSAWSTWLKAQTAVQTTGLLVKTPNGSVQISPAWTITNQAAQKVHDIGASLGLNPSSRTKIHTMGTDAEKDPVSDFNSRRPGRPAA